MLKRLFSKFFGMRRDDAASRPTWASDWTDDQIAQFRRDVDTFFAEHGVEAVNDGSAVRVSEPAGPRRYDLQDLVAACRAVDPAEWPLMIDGYFAAQPRVDAVWAEFSMK